MKNRQTIFTAVLFTLGSMALCQFARAVTPAPDGGYPGGNTAEGGNALFSLTSGTYNTALGYQALFHDTTGGNNTAIGSHALTGNSTGGNNTGTGSQALSSNTTGNYNTANGYVALSNNTNGSSNTATGAGGLHTNTTGGHNTASGYVALYHNTSGSYNTATGERALYNNAVGAHNTANGYRALDSSNGSYNTAVGDSALSNGSGAQNTAMGSFALSSLEFFGDSNVAVGDGALSALGSFFNSGGSNNIALGAGAGGCLVGGSNNIYIGSSGDCNAFPGEDNTIRIGAGQAATFIAGIFNTGVSGGSAVYINSGGQLGTTPSSARFKQDIRRIDKASETLLKLRPVTFRYKKEIDPTGTSQFGLVAEEVEKVNPDLVVRDPDGQPFSVRYDQVNAMLLNEFLKEHKRVQEQAATIAELKSIVARQEKGMDDLAARIKDQDAKLQSVSAQIKMAKPAPKVVINQPQTRTAD